MSTVTSNFWRHTWELRKQIFGLPTVEDVMDAYNLGTLPYQEIYICRHKTGNIWIPYTELEPMKILSETMSKHLKQAMLPL